MMLHAYKIVLCNYKVKELTKRKMKVIGVIYQNFAALDGEERCEGVPEERLIEFPFCCCLVSLSEILN